jgi:hypothetical protein
MHHKHTVGLHKKARQAQTVDTRSDTTLVLQTSHIQGVAARLATHTCGANSLSQTTCQVKKAREKPRENWEINEERQLLSRTPPITPGTPVGTAGEVTAEKSGVTSAQTPGAPSGPISAYNIGVEHIVGYVNGTFIGQDTG